MGKLSVLVVDDATFIRDLVRKTLRGYFPGIVIEEAVNGRKAQLMLTRASFDLILCDWEMPEMSGLELLTWCRAQDNLQSVPFIMVTSRSDKSNVIQAIQAGTNDYIGKPFSSEQLIGKVRKALERAGKIDPLTLATRSGPAEETVSGSASVLTGGATTPYTPGGALLRPRAEAPAKGRTAGKNQGQLRLANSSLACVVKALSLKDALLVVRRGNPLPQVMESAVLDLEQGEQAEAAHLNGYLHSVAALEPRPDSEWLQLVFRFVDADPQKLDYLSRMIAVGTAQRS